ncbi:MAG: hypothetical protein L0Z46_11830 [Nitrospiraceae bacterium]|nr:hypothetical protein [Nitrospiraceae bacterium]
MPVQHKHQGKLVLVVQDDADLRSLLCDLVRELELQVARRLTGMEPFNGSWT